MSDVIEPAEYRVAHRFRVEVPRAGVWVPLTTHRTLIGAEHTAAEHEGARVVSYFTLDRRMELEVWEPVDEFASREDAEAARQDVEITLIPGD